MKRHFTWTIIVLLLGILFIALITHEETIKRNYSSITAERSSFVTDDHTFYSMQTIEKYKSPTFERPKSIFSSRILANGLYFYEYFVDVKPELYEGLDENGKITIFYNYDNRRVNNKPNIESIIDQFNLRGKKYVFPLSWTYKNQRFSAIEESNGKSLQIIVSLNEKEIFSADCIPGPIPTVISAWVIDEDWYVLTYCHHEFDIIKNGNFLNEKENYEESFAFQLLSEKPFYILMRDRKIGFYYDGIIEMSEYDDFEGSYCCMGWMPPQHYENLIQVYARKGLFLYKVIISKYPIG